MNMKKIRIFAFFILLVVVSFSNLLFADNDIKIIIDGNQTSFYPNPIIENGTTLVPMRDSFEALGCRIYWKQETRSAIAVRSNTSIKVTIDSNEAFVNGNKLYLSTVPKIIGESTYVPLRFISEALGAKVEWNGNTRTITILDKTN